MFFTHGVTATLHAEACVCVAKYNLGVGSEWKKLSCPEMGGEGLLRNSPKQIMKKSYFGWFFFSSDLLKFLNHSSSKQLWFQSENGKPEVLVLRKPCFINYATQLLLLLYFFLMRPSLRLSLSAEIWLCWISFLSSWRKQLCSCCLFSHQNLAFTSNFKWSTSEFMMWLSLRNVLSSLLHVWSLK